MARCGAVLEGYPCAKAIEEIVAISPSYFEGWAKKRVKDAFECGRSAAIPKGGLQKLQAAIGKE